LRNASLASPEAALDALITSPLLAVQRTLLAVVTLQHMLDELDMLRSMSMINFDLSVLQARCQMDQTAGNGTLLLLVALLPDG